MKRLDFKYGWLAAIAVAGLASCSEGSGPDNPLPDENKPEEMDRIELSTKGWETSQELNGFYADFTAKTSRFVDEHEKDKNFVISPLSASIILAMTANGVQGELQQEIISMLGIKDLEGMDELMAGLLSALPNVDKETSLNLANSVWVNNSFQLNSKFEQLMAESYRARTDYYDPHNTQYAASVINDWISANTNDKIKDYIKDHNSLNQIMAFLANAMYFQSAWGEKDLFDKAETRVETFHGLSGDTRVEMMKSREVGLTGYVGDDISYVRIPLGNGMFNMEIIVPKEERSTLECWDELCGSLDRIRNFSEYEPKLLIRLPKFKLDTDLQLNEVLESAGLKSLNGNIDLNLFTEGCKGIMRFRQNTIFEIDEKGAEAASVTSNGMVMSPGESYTPQLKEITVDGPFMFFITEKSTGACVVSGRITDLPEVSN